METKTANIEFGTLEKSEESFPLVASASDANSSLADWVQENRALFETKMREDGAILFRNFNIGTVDVFQELMTVVDQNPLPYNFRSSPRHTVGDNVYVSTTHPSDESINMHSESSYAPEHPNHIVFCCVTPAQSGGETPIANNRNVLKYLSEETRGKFKQHGVKYVRTLDKWVGLPWQEVFQTEEKSKVEEECKRTGVGFEWISDDKLRLVWTKKAVWEHPESGEEMWFNHSSFFNKHSLDPDTIEYFEMTDSLPFDTFYGNGEEITKEEIEEVFAAYTKACIEFKWEAGDVLFLDNMLTSHGRNPYQGDRKIIVSIY
jgi:alpha-ketoglutarate-dependent taurine dioxygenase